MYGYFFDFDLALNCTIEEKKVTHHTSHKSHILSHHLGSKHHRNCKHILPGCYESIMDWRQPYPTGNVIMYRL